MKCDTVTIGDTTAIICTRGRRHNCQFCSRYATKQCDFPVIRDGKETTCDAWMCERCATKQHLPGCEYGTPLPDDGLQHRLIASMGDGERYYASEKCTCNSDLDYCPPHERNKLKIMEARLRGKIEPDEPPRIVERL